jgi:chromosome segregation ATPase
LNAEIKSLKASHEYVVSARSIGKDNELQSLKIKLKEAESVRNSTLSVYESTVSALEEERKSRIALNTLNTSLKSETESLRSSLNDKTIHIVSVENSLSESRLVISKLESDVVDKSKVITELEYQLTMLRQSLENHKNLLLKAEQSKQALSVELSKHSDTYNRAETLERDLSTTREYHSSLSESYQSLKNELSDANRIVYNYKTKLDSASAAMRDMQALYFRSKFDLVVMEMNRINQQSLSDLRIVKLESRLFRAQFDIVVSEIKRIVSTNMDFSIYYSYFN